MKKKYILVGLSLAALPLAWLGQIDSSPVQSEYQPRSFARKAEAIAGAADYYKLLRTNVETGEFQPSDLIKGQIAAKKFAHSNNAKALNLSWQEVGPDNVGGRTRGIHVVETNPNMVYTGGVSGGLWFTESSGNWWQRVTGFNDNLAVSSMVRTLNGRLFVGTGATFDSPSSTEGSGMTGNGIWMTDEAGAGALGVNASFSVVDNSQPSVFGFGPGVQKSQWNRLQEDRIQADKLWAGGNAGLFTYTDADGFTEVDRVDENTGATGSFTAIGDIQISTSGNFMIVGERTGASVRTWVSTNAGATWSNVSSSATGGIPANGVGRITYAISPDDENFVYAAAVNTGAGNLRGIYLSQDKGQTWEVIGPGGNSTFDPFSRLPDGGSQGFYDNAITVVPGDKGRIIVGGISLWKFELVSNSPAFGQWELAAFQFGQGPNVVHSDVHVFEWDASGNLYIGHDGGISRSIDDLATFFTANRGFNVTQFYGMDYNAHNEVLGGTQDNSMVYIDHQGTTWQEGNVIFGGDGFEAELSYLNRDVGIATSQFGAVGRSNDGLVSFNDFYSTAITSLGQDPGPFYTNIALRETRNDQFSQDSLKVPIFQPFAPGDTVWYKSLTLDEDLFHITQVQLDSLDTICVVDPIQSLFVSGLRSGNGVWVTRDANRYSTDPFWWNVAELVPSLGTSHTLAWSPDGDHLYVGTFNSDVWRISGFNSLYYRDQEAVDSFLVATRIFTGGFATDVAVDPKDASHVVITTGGFGGSNHVFESNTANTTTNASSFSAIGTNLPSSPRFPVYDAIIDRNDPNIIVVGTEYGVYATDDGGATWEDQNATMERVPTYAVEQQWRDWEDGVFNPGMIYIGTHGRGMWQSGTISSVERPNGDFAEGNTDYNSINVFPNPVQDVGTIAFELAGASDVKVDVYDLNGRLVQTHNLGRMAAGENQVQIDATTLSGGTYIINFQSAFERKIGKMIVSK